MPHRCCVAAFPPTAGISHIDLTIGGGDLGEAGCQQWCSMLKRARRIMAPEVQRMNVGIEALQGGVLRHMHAISRWTQLRHLQIEEVGVTYRRACGQGSGRPGRYKLSRI